MRPSLRPSMGHALSPTAAAMLPPKAEPRETFHPKRPRDERARAFNTARRLGDFVAQVGPRIDAVFGMPSHHEAASWRRGPCSVREAPARAPSIRDLAP